MPTTHRIALLRSEEPIKFHVVIAIEDKFRLQIRSAWILTKPKREHTMEQAGIEWCDSTWTIFNTVSLSLSFRQLSVGLPLRSPYSYMWNVGAICFPCHEFGAARCPTTHTLMWREDWCERGAPIHRCKYWMERALTVKWEICVWH